MFRGANPRSPPPKIDAHLLSPVQNSNSPVQYKVIENPDVTVQDWPRPKTEKSESQCVRTTGARGVRICFDYRLQ